MLLSFELCHSVTTLSFAIDSTATDTRRSFRIHDVLQTTLCLKCTRSGSWNAWNIFCDRTEDGVGLAIRAYLCCHLFSFLHLRKIPEAIFKGVFCTYFLKTKYTYDFHWLKRNNIVIATTHPGSSSSLISPAVKHKRHMSNCEINMHSVTSRAPLMASTSCSMYTCLRGRTLSSRSCSSAINNLFSASTKLSPSQSISSFCNTILKI